ncbi:hypothetical protein quinque_002370 [Culex quinquefasciatus]
MDGRLKLKEEELVGQGKGTLLQRTSSGQQTVDQKRQLPQKPTCQPLQSNALQDSGEDSLTTTEKGSRQLLSCGTTVKEEINRFGQTQIDSAFVDTSRRCGYSGAAKKVVWLKAKKKKLIVRTDERERSLLLKERWLMMGRKPASLTTKTRRSNPWRGTVGWRYTDGWRKIGPVAGRGSTVWDWYEKVPHRRCKRKYEYVPKLDQQQLGLRMLEEEEAALDSELVAKGARKNNSSATIYAFCVDSSAQMTKNERFLRMQVRLTWTLIRIEATLHQHKISWPEESTIHITSSPTIYWQGCHDLSSRNANLYDADPRTPQPASIFNRGSSANRSNAN